MNPDGDALGSTLALSQALKKMGHEVYPVVPNEYPEFLQWLPGNDSVIDYYKNKEQANSIISSAEMIFFLDHNESKRGGDMNEALTASKALKIMIDHHPNPQMEVDYQISFTEASSTCELIFEFIAAIDGLSFMDKSIAECIYTGILTDTGCFSYNSSRTRTFEIAAHLLQYAIHKDEIYSRIYDNYSAQRMRLLGYCLNEKMVVLPDLSTAYMSITLEEQKRFDFATGDSEGFVNYPLSIKGISFTALFTERKDKVKISFRSRGSFPSNVFSERHFSGGGHLNAAGGESNLSLDETIQKFTELLSAYKTELNS
jgi:phosphoesterase RecJ-like protein